jgi:hypothetical protein
VYRRVQSGCLHTWSSVGESAYPPCAQGSIRNMVLYLPGYSSDQGLDSRQVTLYGSPQMKYVAPSPHVTVLTAEFPCSPTLQTRWRTTRYTTCRTNGTRIIDFTALSTRMLWCKDKYYRSKADPCSASTPQLFFRALLRCILVLNYAPDGESLVYVSSGNQLLFMSYGEDPEDPAAQAQWSPMDRAPVLLHSLSPYH